MPTKSEQRLAGWICAAMFLFGIGVEPCWLSLVMVLTCAVCIAALMGRSDWDV